jgi:hypothetical protein
MSRGGVPPDTAVSVPPAMLPINESRLSDDTCGSVASAATEDKSMRSTAGGLTSARDGRAVRALGCATVAGTATDDEAVVDNEAVAATLPADGLEAVAG